MRCTYMKLIGYERFRLNESKVLEITFDSNLQVFLGTNGSGKSSLMEQILPSAPNPSDFKKDGGKIAHYEKDGVTYVLSSMFGDPHPHCFLIDGREQNISHNITSQRELIKKHFGLTPELAAIILGKETFSKMKPPRRKEVFLKLCDSNYDYALAVYAKLKEQLRDVSGAKKIAKAELLAETERMVSKELVDSSREKATVLYRTLNVLLEHRFPQDEDLFQMERKNQEYEREVAQLTSRLNSLLSQADTVFETPEVLQSKIIEQNSIIDRQEGTYSSLSSSFQELNRSIDQLRSADAKSLQDVLTSIASGKEKIKALTAGLKLGSPSRSADPEGLSESIRSILEEMPDNSDKRFVRGADEQVHRSLGENRLRLKNLQEQTLRANARRQHLEKHRDNPDQTCPSCNFKYSSEFDPRDFEKLVQEIPQLSDKFEKLSSEIAEQEKFLADYSQFAIGWRRLHALSDANRHLSGFWSKFFDEEYAYDRSKSPSALFTQLLVDVETTKQIDELEARLSESEKVAWRLKDHSGESLQSLEQSKEQVEKRLQVAAEELSKARGLHSEYSSRLEILRKLSATKEKLTETIDNKTKLGRRYVEQVRRQTYNDCVRFVQKELAMVEQTIAAFDAQQKKIDHLLYSISEHEDAEKDISTLMKILSPSEGLIAEGLFGFIEHYVASVNDFLKKIWTYNLEVQSCGKSEGDSVDLDYEFPLLVHNDPKPVPDISKGSSGMIEIVDLAFQFGAISRLGNFPIFLDEFGRGFDPAHKGASVAIIRSLVEQELFPQVFLISHDFLQYGGLSNCQVAVLNSLNVAPPSNMVVNKHLSFS